MHRMFFAGAVVAFILSAAGWSVIQSATVRPTAADQTLGMALMGALVKYDGTLVLGSGGVVSSSRIQTAVYEIVFDRPVTNCILSATSGGEPSTGTAYVVQPSPRYPFGMPNNIRVVMYNADASGQLDATFHLMVFCPK
jgi:hypothetical protein